MRVAVPRETAPGERRVALVPESIQRLIGDGFSVAVETGAGADAGFADNAYGEAGADVTDTPYSDAAIVARVAPPSTAEVEELATGTVLVGFLAPLTDAA